MTRSFKYLLLASVCMLSLSACGDNSSSKQNKDSTQEDSSSVEQVLTVGLSAPIKTLDVSKAVDNYSGFVLTQTLEGLTSTITDDKGNDKIIPGVAKSWETSADGLEWTFHLRNANWNDGKPVVAEDFKYSILRTLNPQTASTYAFILSPIKNATKYNSGKAKAEEVGIQVIDDHTIKFTLEHPTGYFLSLTAGKTLLPQRKDIVEKNGSKNGSSLQMADMGNGPFKLSDWTPSSKMTLVKNNSYWDAKNVKLQTIHVPIILETSACVNMLYNGQLDVASVSKPEWINKLKSSGKFNVTQGYTGSETHGIFNLTDKVFKNTKIRQAFSLSVTRKDLANVIFHSIFEPAYGWTPPKVMVGDQEYRAVTPEPLLALKKKYPDPKALLVEGLKELGMDSDPSHLTITYLNSGTSSFSKKSFEYYQQMWHKTLGVTVKGEFVQWPVFLKKLMSHDFQLASLSWGGYYNDPNTFFDLWTSKAGMYDIGFKDPKYDTLIANIQNEVDQSKRLKMFQQAEKILVNEKAIIFPTAYRKTINFSYKKVHGLHFPTFARASYKDTYIK